ncbi:MAG TPA: pyridoxamine 5'-phosphate oxidase family protein [Solirubrobacteraceae bacterium]|nr:pyridoxamine 5'-phosphate oxidase family protein [Solirubrobacteraceae bacterium]
MHETPEELERLQSLLEDSIEQAGPFLRTSFEMPEHSLSAGQLAAHLQGSLTVALATVTARAEPRVAPIGALFLHGSFFVPTVAEAARARHLSRRPAASLTYFEGTKLAVIVHGRVTVVDARHPDFAELDAVQVGSGGQSVREWQGHGVYLHLHPARVYTYAREPGFYPPSG